MFEKAVRFWTPTLFLAVTVACSDSAGPTAPTTTAAPPPPSPPSTAEVEVEALGAFALVDGQGNLLLLELRMEERSGVGVNIDFIRVEVFRATGELEERLEIGAENIIQQTGTNRLEAGASRQDTWALRFRAAVKSGRALKVTVGFTDDRGTSFTRLWISGSGSRSLPGNL